LNILAPSVVIPLGFDLSARDEESPDAEDFYRRFPRAGRRPLVLFLSRLDPKKNVEALLQAFANLTVDAGLIIAGAGDAEYVARLQAIAKELAIDERVTWTGHIEGRVKHGAYAAASVFVLPSMSENFGIALLEAMAAGLACISSAGVALASEAAREHAVELVPPAAPEILAAAIDRLIVDDEARLALGARARELAARYSLPRMGQSLCRLYQAQLTSAEHL
jgi:glycosyltransferase involved in cell wall biosynthesis